MTTTYNNGKDIMLEDIVVVEKTHAITKKKAYYAFLSLFPWDDKTGIKKDGGKFYFGGGDTPTEARDSLLDALIGNLIDLKSTKRFPL